MPCASPTRGLRGAGRHWAVDPRNPRAGRRLKRGGRRGLLRSMQLSGGARRDVGAAGFACYQHCASPASECSFARMGAVAPPRGGAPGRRPRADERVFVRPWCGNPRCRNDPRSNATRSVVDWSPPRPTCSPLFRQGSAFFAALNSRGTRSSAIGTTPAPQSTRRSAEAQSADCLKVRVFRTILCGG